MKEWTIHFHLLNKQTNKGGSCKYRTFTMALRIWKGLRLTENCIEFGTCRGVIEKIGKRGYELPSAFTDYPAHLILVWKVLSFWKKNEKKNLNSCLPSRSSISSAKIDLIDHTSQYNVSGLWIVTQVALISNAAQLMHVKSYQSTGSKIWDARYLLTALVILIALSFLQVLL